MPELPEVETIARGLRKALCNKIITEVSVLFPGIVISKQGSLKRLLTGDRILRVERHGKYILFTTKKGTRFIVHLRMTGQLIVTDDTYKKDKHVHLILTFKDGKRLVYRDIRKFGRWTVVSPHKEFMDHINAGTDALSIDHQELSALIKRCPHRKLKAFLLDQVLLAGVGNIYADEICYSLGVDPETEVQHVRTDSLLSAIKAILLLAIKNKGTSVSDYITSRNAKGNFQNLLHVYRQRTCRTCGTTIIRKKVAGRTSHVCPKCQKSPSGK